MVRVRDSASFIHVLTISNPSMPTNANALFSDRRQKFLTWCKDEECYIWITRDGKICPIMVRGTTFHIPMAPT